MQLLKVQEYGKGSIRNYLQELTSLFKHHNDIPVGELRQEYIERYFIFIKEMHSARRVKYEQPALSPTYNPNLHIAGNDALLKKSKINLT